MRLHHSSYLRFQKYLFQLLLFKFYFFQYTHKHILTISFICGFNHCPLFIISHNIKIFLNIIYSIICVS